MAGRKTVTIEDGILRSLAASKAALREFPFLSSLVAAPAKKSCGGCAAAAAGQRVATDNVRRAIAGLDSARKQRLKQFLGNADSVSISIPNGTGSQYYLLTF